METFLTWLSANPTATVSVSILVVALVLIYLIAFLQGREISFWPPKIGSRPPKTSLKAQSNGGMSEITQSLTEKTGLVVMFENLEACRVDMQTDFEKASHIQLLLQLGRREFGDRKSSLFWSSAQKKIEPGSQIKVLLASENSPFLSEPRAKRRGTQVEQWREDGRRLKEEIKRLKEFHHVEIEVREHFEPFLWRIFIFDDIAYVSGYLYARDNDKYAEVYKFKKGGSSLYGIFSKYFDYLWKKYEPSRNRILPTEDEIKKWSSWV